MTLVVFLEFRHAFRALRLGIGASGMKAAALGRVHRAGNIALKNYALTGMGNLRVRHGNCRQQRFCIGVHRVLVQLVALAQLDQAAKIHNTDAAGDMANNGKVVRDEKIGKTQIVLHILQHIDNLRLDGNIKRGDRLVAYNELRLDRQCAGYADALLLTARKLVRKTVGVFGISANAGEQRLNHLLSLLFVGSELVNINCLANDFADSHARVKRS